MTEVLYNSNLKSTNQNGDVPHRKFKTFLAKKVYSRLLKEVIRKAQHSKMLKLISQLDNKKKLKINFCRSIGKPQSQ